MDHEILEEKLYAKIKKRRTITIVLCVVFFIVAAAFVVARRLTMTVEVINLGGHIDTTIVTYNDNLSWGFLIGGLGLVFAAGFLADDLLRSKLTTIEVEGHYVTYYRHIFCELYVDGEIKDRSAIDKHYLEAVLPNGVKVDVAIGRRYSHISFSNGQRSVDI